MLNAPNAKRGMTLLGFAACWLVLTGCPAILNQYSLFKYLPLTEGNSWVFGCVPTDTSQDMVDQEVTVSKVVSIADRTVWITSGKSIPSDESAPTYSGDVYYILHENVLYSTDSLKAVEDLPESLDTSFEAFIHEDLTPREIDDPNDPVVRQYGASIRYSAGTLKDFLPISFTRNGDPSAWGTVEIDDFAESVREIVDCIALETNAGGQWTPAYIFGRSVGPLLVSDGLGGYATLQRAKVDCDQIKAVP